MVTFEPQDVEEYKVFNDNGLELATIKKCDEWVFWNMPPGVCLSRSTLKQITKKLKELNNGN